MTLQQIRIGGLAAALMLVAAGEQGGAQESVPVPKGSTAIRRYVYAPPTFQPVPPPYPYGFGYSSGRLYQPPPVGFGSPYYNGYNDPYFNLYGPGVRDFLRFGGADFYGW